MAQKISEETARQIMLDAGFKPLENFRGGDYPWRCVCLTCGKESSPRFRGVRDKGSGCKYCAGNFIDAEDAVNQVVELGFEPIENFPGASKPWKMKCLRCNEINSPMLASIRMGHDGCKNCANKNAGRNRRLDMDDSKYSAVLAVMSEVRLKPLEPFSRGSDPWKSECLDCGNLVTKSYHRIKSNGIGCSKCASIRKSKAQKLDSHLAVKIMNSKNYKPLVDYPGAMEPWLCLCLDCGNEVSPRYAHIQQGRKGCLHCGRKKNADNRRESQETAFAVARSCGFEPLEPYKNRHAPWLCKCLNCGETISPHYARMLIGGGCRYCSGLVVNPESAKKVMLAAGLTPLIEYPGSGKPWLCKCQKCNREVSPRYAGVNSGLSGCKFCASHGYDFTSPGVLYLITHEKLNAHKIGITNAGSKEKRIEKHLAQGWQIYKTAIFEDGNHAYLVEQSILEWWRNELDLPIFLSVEDMPQRGFTETVDALAIDLSTIWKFALKAKSELN